jgi:hypothetical protein
MTSEHIDRLTLISYFTGDCDNYTRRIVESHCAQCGQCRGALEKLEHEKKEFLARYPYESPVIRPHTKKNIIHFPRPLIALAATVLIAVSVVILYRSSLHKSNYYGIKGDTGIKIYVKKESEAVESRNNHIYYPGEYIQITYSCGKMNRFILLSIDRNGNISTYYPAGSDSSIVLEPGANLPLPNSIELDSYLGTELFIALFSESKKYVPEIVERIERAYRNQNTLKKLKIEPDNDMHAAYIPVEKKRRSQ